MDIKLCLFCQKYFKNEDELNEHLKVCDKKNKRNPTRKIKKFKCKHCGILCKTEDGLSKHYIKCTKKIDMELLAISNEEKLIEYMEENGKTIKSIRFGDIMRQSAYIPINTSKK